MEKLFIKYQLIRFKHLILLLKQIPEGQPLPFLISEYCGLREFLSEFAFEETSKVVDEYASDWVKGL